MNGSNADDTGNRQLIEYGKNNFEIRSPLPVRFMLNLSPDETNPRIFRIVGNFPPDGGNLSCG